ncbi:phosphomethylpyrimidine synthase [Bacteroidia bacterium]|nr:phosphomethylpyrimidine synthase [Bacteroidia bacterium]
MNTIFIGNKLRGNKPVPIGDKHFPLIFANVGVNNGVNSLITENEKIKHAICVGADAITDLSMVDNIPYIQSKLIESINKPFSVVTTYEAFILAQKNSIKISSEAFVRIFEQEALRGVDVITLHATAFKDDIFTLNRSKRIIPCTSRGGAMMLEILKNNEYENPYYLHLDEILSIAAKYGVCISLGPCYRAGTVCDSLTEDELYLLELQRMSEILGKAQKKNVPIMMEGIGHASIDRIPQIITKAKATCHNAPYRVLTVATDIALGYDHIASAIASAIAVQNGANSITCVTRSEHIGLPSVEDIEEAIITAKIAAHCGFIAKTGEFRQDKNMSIARTNKGCLGQIDQAIYKDGALAAMLRHNNERFGKTCDMCREYCPFEIINKL